MQEFEFISGECSKGELNHPVASSLFTNHCSVELHGGSSLASVLTAAYAADDDQSTTAFHWLLSGSACVGKVTAPPGVLTISLLKLAG